VIDRLQTAVEHEMESPDPRIAATDWSSGYMRCSRLASPGRAVRQGDEIWPTAAAAPSTTMTVTPVCRRRCRNPLGAGSSRSGDLHTAGATRFAAGSWHGKMDIEEAETARNIGITNLAACLSYQQLETTQYTGPTRGAVRQARRDHGTGADALQWCRVANLAIACSFFSAPVNG